MKCCKATGGYLPKYWPVPGGSANCRAGCATLGLARVLIVTDPGVAALPFFPLILASLEKENIAVSVFKDVHPDPVADDVAAGLRAFTAHEAEMVIAIGGGSGLDCGKSIALAAATARPLWDFEITLPTLGLDRPMPPIFAIPTTAGTGSEVGRATVITDVALSRKIILLHPQMLPKLVILDAELTFGLPASLTAWTGMDALAHSLEAFCVPAWHPVADGIAVEGMRIIKNALVTAVTEPKNVAARGKMLAAAAMGCDGLSKRPGRNSCAEPPDRRQIPFPSRAHQCGADALRAGL